MNIEKRKETERLSVGVVLAVLIHLLLFLIIEYGGFFLTPEEADYIGPVFVELADVTSIPEAAKVESPDKPEDRPLLETTEADAVDESSTPRETAPATDRATSGEKGESDLLTSKDAEPTPERFPETRGETDPETYTPIPRTAPTVRDDSIYDGKDSSSDFTIRMSDKSDKARPIFRQLVDLPRWVVSQNVELEVTFSFIVGTDGMITHVYLDKSSGYKDVDRAVERSLLKWKFSNPIRKERIMGAFTYRTNQR
jgi:TonB family protein